MLSPTRWLCGKRTYAMGRPVLGERIEPRGHVLDLHDVETLLAALVEAARLDIAHEAAAGVTCRWNGVSIRACLRGGHVCPGCHILIWDCGRKFLENLAATILEGGDPGAVLTLLNHADHAEKGPPKMHVHRPEYPSACTGCEHLGWQDAPPSD